MVVDLIGGGRGIQDVNMMSMDHNHVSVLGKDKESFQILNLASDGRIQPLCGEGSVVDQDHVTR